MDKHQPSEAMKKARRSYYYQRKRESILAKLKERYREDQDFRNHAKERYRRRYHEDPDYHAKTLERAKQRYHKRKKLKVAADKKH